MKRDKQRTASVRTQRAARAFNRRLVLKSAAALVGCGALAPVVIGAAACAAAGELKLLLWSHYLPDSIKRRFERETGITLKVASYGSNEQLLNRLKATRGRGADIVGPSLSRAPQWRDLDLLQPWDMNRVPSERIVGGLLKGSTEAWGWSGGQLYLLPYLWGTEALSWRSDKWHSSYADLSYGDLWAPEMQGKVQGRPHSMMAGIGLYLDRIGSLPWNRLRDAYRDEDSMRHVWDGITRFAVEHKSWIRQFWNDHDGQRAGLIENGVVLGQTWDGPPLELKKAGQPVSFMAPQEGALAWLDGLAIPIGARNIEAIYAFLDLVYRPEVGGLLGNETGYNPAAAGAAAHLDESSRRAFREAYPDDALDRLWWWPAEPVWYAVARAEYRNRFLAA